jgi:hypothetical protein
MGVVGCANKYRIKSGMSSEHEAKARLIWIITCKFDIITS